MRPAGRSERDSLYFEYREFPAPVRQKGVREKRRPVAIVGAGPVGLIAALTLAKYGVASVLFERKATFNDGSRAICLARQTYHILERLGAIEPFLRKSLGWTTGRSFYRGHQVLEFTMRHSRDEKFLPMYNLQQQYIEQFLWECVAKSPYIDLRWRSEVVRLSDLQDGILLDIRDPDGEYGVEADWVLAADGARSAVRKMRGLRLHGDNYEGRYVIADIQMAIDYPTIRRALFDSPSNPELTILVHRQPDNIWRIDYQLSEHDNAEEAVCEKAVRARVAAILQDLGHSGAWELEWWSDYSANTLALDDYRDGRVFFIGDSAHIVPIFGVRGLNNGIADAENIGWKLARVITGHAGEGILDSFTPERRGATLDVFANASKSTRFMAPPSYGWKLMRDAAMSLSITQEFPRELANPRQMTPYTYADSALSEPDQPDFDGGAVPGAVIPNVRLADGSFLSDRFGQGYSILWFAPRKNHRTAVRLQEACRRIDPYFTLIIVSAHHQDDGILDRTGELARRFGAPEGAFYLVRPDLHVAARRPHLDVPTVVSMLTRMLDRMSA